MHVTCVPGEAANATGVPHAVAAAGVRSGTKNPTVAVIIPVTKKAPPATTYPMSETQAKTFPDKMVPRHDEKDNATRIGPMIAMIIPKRKISSRI